MSNTKVNNINITLTTEAVKYFEKTRCRCCGKRVQVMKVHQQSKYCLAVRKVLDKLSPSEVGLLKTGKPIPYYY